ncbi:MAG: hypothetical protein ACXV2I_03110 [Actinomycetes bacterium]
MSVQDHRELVAALLAVEGVAGASVEPVGEGPGTLRLQLSPGTDEVKVAGAVNRLLRARFGLAVDADRVRVLDEAGPLPPVPPAAEPEPAPEPEPEPEPGHEHRNNHEHKNHHAHEHDHEPERPAPGEVPEPAPAHEPTSAASYAQAGPFRTAVSEPEGAAGRVESSLPEPEGAVVTGSGGAAYGFHDPERPDVPVVRPGRLAIKRVELVSAGLGVAVTVSLGRGGRTVTGEAEGAATQSGVHRSVATATLRAVESVVEGQARFEVEHIELARTGADQTVLVVLTMVTGRSVQRLSGASVVREDVRQAVVRAVLDAVNRRMEPMLVSS